MSLVSIHPATGETLARYEETSPEGLARAAREAQAAFGAWRGTPLEERARVLLAAGRGLLRERDALARLMAREMGKPLAQGRAELEKCAGLCGYYAESAGRFLAPEPVALERGFAQVAFEPLGLVLALMPWNFPFWQVLRCAAPALMAGNGVLLKHDAHVTGCALALGELLRGAGLPAGLLQVLLLSAERAHEAVALPQVRAVTLTGSSAAGRAVAAQAGALLKKTVLELGGSDPYLILADADLESAAEACAAARLINAGQSCVAAKRFIVVPEVRERFEALLVRAMAARTWGDPEAEGTELGPLARRDLRERLHGQVERSLARGARLLLGGTIPEGPGAYYPPTVLTEVREGMAAAEEELFGPVAAVLPARDEADALRLANASEYGLGAAVFTRDRARGERLARFGLEAGSCFVNAAVRSDQRLPFGGVKSSGYGRELGGFGIREFVNIKSVVVE